MAKNALTARKELKLQESARKERQKALSLRRELKEAHEELESTDWLATSFNIAAGLGGAAASGSLRAMGWTADATHWEPIGALAIGVIGARQESPLAVSFAQGLASRWVSERVEQSVLEMRNAVAEKRANTAASADGEPAPVTAQAQAQTA